MSDYRESINRQYGEKELDVRLIEAIINAGVDVNQLTLDDLSWFDQLHAGGRVSTNKLAKMANLKSGMKVLDVGCGVGGSARILASKFGCRVTGVDLASEYVKAAKKLTDIVGLSTEVDFQEGNALELDFDNGSFDAVWTQSAIMNIKNTKKFIQEVYRVLRPNGIFAVEGVIKGVGEETRFPVLWADNQSVSFLTTAECLRQIFSEVGFDEVDWRDVTQEKSEFSHKKKSSQPNKPHPLRVLFKMIQPNLAEKIKNTSNGHEDGIYRTIYGVYKKNLDDPVIFKS